MEAVIDTLDAHLDGSTWLQAEARVQWHEAAPVGADEHRPRRDVDLLSDPQIGEGGLDQMERKCCCHGGCGQLQGGLLFSCRVGGV